MFFILTLEEPASAEHDRGDCAAESCQRMETDVFAVIQAKR